MRLGISRLSYKGRAPAICPNLCYSGSYLSSAPRNFGTRQGLFRQSAAPALYENTPLGPCMTLGCNSRTPPVDIILFFSSPLIVIATKDGIAQLNTGDFRGREILNHFILYERDGETDNVFL